MALVKLAETALISKEDHENQQKRQLPKKNVLDEDAYTEGLEKIIQRDFFPDLSKLQAQSEYLDALEKKDTEKLRQIQIKYGPKRNTKGTPSIYSTPASFETPESRISQTPQTNPHQTPSGEVDDRGSTFNPEPSLSKEKKDATLTLDKYLAKNTSEDNASFAEIMHENEVKHRQRHAWLYETEERQQDRHDKMMALPTIEKQAIDSGTTETESWKYVAKNSLMYVPDGCLLSPDEKVQNKKAKNREILHKNTRFEINPFNEQQSKQTIAEAASIQALSNQGKIGVDGKEIIPQESPKVNGYGFAATPSPAPGVDESPLMTWGEIEGTPFRLDAGDTPTLNAGGPVFKIPQVPRRDRLGLELAEKASKAHRTKKDEALKQVTARLTSPNLKFGSATSTERLHSLSPAAQQLASKRLGIRTNTDKALRASYTPSPSHTPGSKTPVVLTPSQTPKGITPRSSRSNTPSKDTPKRISSAPVSLTDNLLNLPKRRKAQDFF